MRGLFLPSPSTLISVMSTGPVIMFPFSLNLTPSECKIRSIYNIVGSYSDQIITSLTQETPLAGTKTNLNVAILLVAM